MPGEAFPGQALSIPACRALGQTTVSARTIVVCPRLRDYVSPITPGIEAESIEADVDVPEPEWCLLALRHFFGVRSCALPQLCQISVC